MHTRLMALAAVLAVTCAVAGCSDDDVDLTVEPSAKQSETPTPTTSSPAESTAPAGPVYFETAVTPRRGAAPGVELTSRGTGATPSTDYYCLLAVYDTAGGGVSAPLESSLTSVTSTNEGAVTCRLPHEPFTGEDTEGVERHCPTTPADRKDGFSCGVVLVDAVTLGAESASAAPFIPRP